MKTHIVLAVAFTLLLVLFNVAGATALLSGSSETCQVVPQDRTWLIANDWPPPPRPQSPTLPPDPLIPWDRS
jgi:hypothetical protein